MPQIETQMQSSSESTGQIDAIAGRSTLWLRLCHAKKRKTTRLRRSSMHSFDYGRYAGSTKPATGANSKVVPS